ncbi:hypothetical protein FRC08_007513 [Ceratobasidium sp. 394]|nr:hypothetical protein FRC08_007513 [Ceratobasidium sp. 394]
MRLGVTPSTTDEADAREMREKVDEVSSMELSSPGPSVLRSISNSHLHSHAHSLPHPHSHSTGYPHHEHDGMLSILAPHEEEVLRAQDAVHDLDGGSNLAGSSYQHRADPHDLLMDSMTMNLGGLAYSHHSLHRQHLGNMSLVGDVLPELYIPSSGALCPASSAIYALSTFRRQV